MGWYELYRRCDVDGSFSLELEEAFRFARICFEMALYWHDPALLATGIPPLAPSAPLPCARGASSVNTPTMSSQASIGRGGPKTKMKPATLVSSSMTRCTSGAGIKAIIENALANIEAPGQLRASSMECFKEADSNKDGYLMWENDEVHKFVRFVFERYALQRPSWPTLVWAELYKVCGLEQSAPVGFEAAFDLVKHCLELRGYETDGTSGPVASERAKVHL